MTNQSQNKSTPVVFKFQESVQLRVISIDGEPWFVASDVAKALGYNEPHKAISTHCKKAKPLIDIDGMIHPVQQNQGLDSKAKFIPESDFYRLVIRSKLETAEVFQDWVTEEVLPSIRKTGKYESATYGLKDLPKAPRAKLALPGCLTLEEQDLINDTIAERLATLPKEKQGKAAQNIRGALVTKWDVKGVKHGYKNIPSDQFTNVMNFITRVELDGDNYLILPKDELNRLLDERVQVELKALASPVKEGEVLTKSNNTIVVDLPLPAGMTQLTYKFNTEGLDYGRWAMWQSDGEFTIRVMDNDEFLTSSKALPKYIADSMGGMVKKSDLPAIIKAAADRL